MVGDGFMASALAKDVVNSVVEWHENGQGHSRGVKRRFKYGGPIMTGVATESIEAASLSEALHKLANNWLSLLLDAPRSEEDEATASVEFSLEGVDYRLDIDLTDVDNATWITQLNPVKLRVEPETYNRRKLAKR